MTTKNSLIERKFSYFGELSNKSFRVCSWNSLADILAQTGKFIGKSFEILSWEYRLPLIKEEIKRCDADIICLAECNHYEDILSFMNELGYDGVYAQKLTSPVYDVDKSKTYEKYSEFGDGCAIFYDKRIFTLINQLSERDNPVNVSVHLSDPYKNDLIVAMVHLKAKKPNFARRKEQTINVLKRLKQLYSQPRNNKVGVIVCGDFNAEDYEECIVLMKKCGYTIAPSLEWTTYKERKKDSTNPDGIIKRRIDYIFHCSNLVPLSLWLEPKDLTETLPCTNYPSDHLAIANDFKFK